MTESIASQLPVPFPLVSSDPWLWRWDGSTLRALAKTRSDIFIDPRDPDGEGVLNAARLMGCVPGGDFMLSARISVHFRERFDAGVLLLWHDDRHWAKLCFEAAINACGSIVSVVSRGVADDAYSYDVPNGSVWVRISRVDQVFGFHASEDGETWRFIRMFSLESASPLQLGFEVQSPNGDGCDVAFERIAYSSETLKDFRSGI